MHDNRLHDDKMIEKRCNSFHFSLCKRNNSQILKFVIKNKYYLTRSDKIWSVSSPLSRIRVPVATYPSKSGRKTCRRAEKGLPLRCQNENQ